MPGTNFVTHRSRLYLPADNRLSFGFRVSGFGFQNKSPGLIFRNSINGIPVLPISKMRWGGSTILPDLPLAVELRQHS